MSGQTARLLGQWGERLVAEDLRRRGFSILAENYRCRFGEIDLIAADEQYLSFTEVKLRRSRSFVPACCAVDWRKQQKLRTTAEHYLTGHPTQLQPRFDVAEVYAPQGLQTVHPAIYYIINAF